MVFRQAVIPLRLLLSTSSIVITFDLPTAAVVTFVLILLGLAAGLLLMARLSFTDHAVMG